MLSHHFHMMESAYLAGIVDIMSGPIHWHAQAVRGAKHPLPDIFHTPLIPHLMRNIRSYCVVR